MQSTPKKINGFTILEVIIVLSLVGIISAIGIPQFNSWNKDRVVRAEAERVRDIVTSITSQVQRGLYGFGQFQVCLLYTSPSPRDLSTSRMPSSA